MNQIRVRQDGVLALEGFTGFRASGSPAGTSPMYGAGGLFGVCGVDSTLINACVSPVGVEAWIPWFGTKYQSPIIDALTYVGTSGYAQSGLCSDCGVPNFRECTQSFCLGRICQMTNEHAFDQIGLHMNPGVQKMAMLGAITDPAGNVLIGQGEVIDNMFDLEIIGAGAMLRLGVATMIWTGNPAANLGGYWEFPGLALQVNTGKRDALTNQLCNGLDSYVRNYNNQVMGAAGSASMYREIVALHRSISHRVRGAFGGEVPRESALVVHPRHWDCLPDVIACERALQCASWTAAQVNQVNQDGQAAQDRAQEYRSRMAIPVDGDWLPVIIDSQIPSTPVSIGSEIGFRSDMYYLTKSVNGENALYGEFQNFNDTVADVIQWFQAMFGKKLVAITDGGRFAVAASDHNGFCFDARVLTKPRVILRIPYMSGRLNNVICIPAGSYADVTGSGGLYERDGGPSTKPYLGLYGDCGALEHGGTGVR